MAKDFSRADIAASASGRKSNAAGVFCPKSDKNKLISELKNSRVMLNPGHKGEVFCLAAIEAKEL